MDLGLEGKVALVMAASKGIGRGIAITLAREGARVAIAGRDEERLEAAAELIDIDAKTFVADTDDLDRLASLPREVEDALGPVEILVTNTGGPPPGGSLDFEREQWETAYRSLVLAPLALIGGVVPGMRERGWGRIVNVGSTATLEPLAGLALSNSHRLATVGLFKSLAAEIAQDGITVNTVATGMFATDRLKDTSGSLDAAEQFAGGAVPAGRLGLPDEYGDLVAFLASERAGYLTGTVIPLDGGLLKGI